MLVLVDTNVFLRAVDSGHSQHALASQSLRSCQEVGDELCVIPQVHYEFWVVATRPLAQNGLGLTTDEAETELREFGPPLFRLLRDEPTIYDLWRDLVARHQVHGKNAHDARIVAAMQRHGVTHLMTFNSADFKRYPGIELLDPTKN